MSDFKSRKAVYALGDPQTGEIRYIGCAAHPWTRLKAHLSLSRRRLQFPVHYWLRDLQSRGLKPVLAVLYWTLSPWLERRVIEEFRLSGSPLLNVSAGGIGGPGCRVYRTFKSSRGG